jgi:competence protein ComEA
LISVPMVLRWIHKDDVIDFSAFDKEIAAIDTSSAVQSGENYIAKKDEFKSTPSTKIKLSLFNPNTATDAELLAEGLSAKQVHTLINFRNKGGKFFKKEDVQKIYGISAEQYAALEPYINIPSKEKPDYTTTNPAKPYVKLAISLIDIATADSTTLLQLKGIGPAFASRIIKYRNKLGGFISKEQLKEVYGIDSTKYNLLLPQISISANHVKRININIATVDDLKQHPYIKGYSIANAIFNYRKQHGNYKSIQDLKHISILNEDFIKKMEPYIAID